MVQTSFQQESLPPGLESGDRPGLWLAADDLLAGNIGRVLSVLQEGLASGEHARFVEQLAKRCYS